MNAVDTAVNSFMQSEEYQSMSYEKQCEAVGELLCQLAESGTEECPYSLIQADTITFNDLNGRYTPATYLALYYPK